MPPMTHVDDLYEPGDEREPEPDERDEEYEPLDLSDIEDAYAGWTPSTIDKVGMSIRTMLLTAPELIAELRDAREQIEGLRRRIAEWEALPTREEWALTQDRATPPTPNAVPYTESVMDAAAKHGVQAWRRAVTTEPVAIHPWEPIDDDAPF